MKQQKGFSILAVILVIVAVIVVIGVWIFSGEHNSIKSSNNIKTVQAASIISTAQLIQSEFDRLVINGADPYQIVYTPFLLSTNTHPNILDPINGIIVDKVNYNSTKEYTDNPYGIISGQWYYNITSFPFKGTNTPDIFINTLGIKDNVCAKINLILHDYDGIPDSVFNEEHKDWKMGCTVDSAATAADQNVFYSMFKVL